MPGSHSLSTQLPYSIPFLGQPWRLSWSPSQYLGTNWGSPTLPTADDSLPNACRPLYLNSTHQEAGALGLVWQLPLTAGNLCDGKPECPGLQGGSTIQWLVA